MRILFVKIESLNWVRFLVILLFFSCTKSVKEKFVNEIRSEAPKVNCDSIYQSNLKDCSCLSANDGDFKFELTIDGKKLCFDRQRQPDSVFNFWANSWGSNAIYMERINADSTLRLSIEYYRPAFLKHGLPYLLNYYTGDTCEAMGIHIINLSKFETCTCSSDATSHYSLMYYGLNTVSIKILSYADNTIEGTFEGDFVNECGGTFKVTNGYFKTRLRVPQ